MLKNNSHLNWPLVGNKHVTDFLVKIIAKDEVSGTYIFHGPDNLGKTTLAVFLAQILLCSNKANGSASPCGNCSSCRCFNINDQAGINVEGEQEGLNLAHGDFHIVKKEKDKKNVIIEQVRDLIRSLNMSSFLNSYKIGIIKHADLLSNEAANALLKTLEEPKDKVVIILIVQDLNSMHSTIVSRSKVLNFYPVATEVIYNYLIDNFNANRTQALNYSRVACGRPALAVKFLEDKNFTDLYEQKVNIFLNFFNQKINDRLASLAGLIDKKDSGQLLVRKVARTIEIWQGIARDCLLLEFRQDHLIQHVLADNNIRTTSKLIFGEKLLNLNKLLNHSMGLLAANVNPKIVLENIVINL